MQCDVLSDDSLVDKMGDHPGSSYTDYLVVALEGPFELYQHSFGDQQSDLRHFGVYDCDEGGVDVGEVGRGHLRLYDRTGQQTPSSVNVLVEQLHHHILDV